MDFVATAVGPGTHLPLDLEQVRQGLALLADPTGWCQLQALPYGHHRERPGADLEGLLADAQALQAYAPRALALILNPVSPGLDRCVTARGIARRRWLMVDVDAVRPNTKAMATDVEHAAAVAACEAVVGYLSDQGWPGPVVVDTGNGCTALYRVALPHNDSARVLCGNALRSLALLMGEMPGAVLDAATNKATQFCKLPGSWSCKGRNTPERPWRQVRILWAPEAVREVSTAQLAALAAPLAGAKMPASSEAHHENPASPFTARSVNGPTLDGPHPYARQVLDDECRRLASTQEGGRNNQAFVSSAAVGNYVASGRLCESECRQRLLEAALSAGLPEREAASTIERGLRHGLDHPKGVPAPPPPPAGRGGKKEAPPPPIPPRTIAEVATLADLRLAGAELRWLWPGWIQVGVVNAVAAPAGVGKTRFMADLCRRIYQGGTWPDGQPIGLPTDTRTLWVLADNHHDEFAALMRAYGIGDEVVYLNTIPSDPYGGTGLEERADMAALEANVAAAQPAMVVIDTVGNSTDRNLSRQEEAKAYYQPLQLIARKCRCAVVCVTHLNAGGGFLGRRVLEKVRCAIQLAKGSDERRRVEMVKSNSKTPSPLGVTMGDGGNEYDDHPPEPAMEGAAPRLDTKTQEAVEWLRSHLNDGTAKRVSITRNLAEQAGITKGSLYRAKELLKVTEFESEGFKWWRLTTDSQEF